MEKTKIVLILVFALVLFFLSKRMYARINPKIMWFWGIVGIINLVAGALFFLFDMDVIAATRLTVMAIPVTALAFGWLYWRKKRDAAQ